MNASLIASFGAIVLLYALLWHDQPAHKATREKSGTEAVFNFLLDFYLPTKILNLAADFVVAKTPKIISSFKTSWGGLKQKLSPCTTRRKPADADYVLNTLVKIETHPSKELKNAIS